MEAITKNEVSAYGFSGYEKSGTLDPDEHYLLNLNAAIYHLLCYLDRLYEVGGRSLEDYFKYFPFLRLYFQQIKSYMPPDITTEDDMESGLAWWCQTIASLEFNTRDALPLRSLDEFIGFPSRMVLMLVTLVEEDSRFGTVFSELQLPLGHRRPMLETLGQVVLKPDSIGMNSWSVCEPLLQIGLLEVENPQLPRPEWTLKLRDGLWNLLRGNGSLDHIEYPLFKSAQLRLAHQLTAIDDLVVDPEFKHRLRNLPGMIQRRQIDTVVMRALAGSHCVEIFGAVAAELEMGTLLLTVHPLPQNDGEITLPPHLGCICTLLNAMPVLQMDLTPGDKVELPGLRGYRGPVALVAGFEGGISVGNADKVLNLILPPLTAALRQQVWRQAVAEFPIENIEQIAAAFRLPGDYIKQVAAMALNNAVLEQRDAIQIADVRSASRNLNRQMLDTLADHLDAKGDWSQLITTDSTAVKLRELQQRSVYREQLLDYLGSAFKNSSNCGVRALFTGKSGTGKTLAAKILAAELGMDIYRVDLAAIVNKYIGETEKNLHKVLTRAESLDVILLLDEGDALLGSRTEVKNANDRYANLETNYLLQRLEHYQGIVLVTTNLSENIDKAFQRRMDIVIPFYQPQMDQRLQIFYLHLPNLHHIEHGFLSNVAKFCVLTGGQIRNVCLHATLMALEENNQVANAHLEAALRSEYQKNGGTYPLDSGRPKPESDGGMSHFINALGQH